MLRILAIVILLAVVLPVHGQEQSTHPGGNQDDSNRSINPPSPPLNHANCEVKQDGTTIECEWPEAKPQGYLERLFSPENAPTIALVIVGIDGQIQVAKSDTQSMIRAERAWIVVSVQSPSHGRFVYTAKNVGKTPARIISIWARPLKAERGKDLDVYSDEVTEEGLPITPPQLLPPTATCVVHDFNIKEVESNTSYLFDNLFTYGRIRYFDVLNEDPKVPYETRWLYWHVPIEGAMPFPDPGYPQHNSYS
jgi:hypothetical protein